MVSRFCISSTILLFMAIYLCIHSCASTELVTPDTLTNMILDNSTGDLYIGGKNFLLKTNENLVTLTKNITGPVLDNPECYPLPLPCDKKRYPTDNYNKILLLHKSEKQIITCGNVYLGVCEGRDMNTLREVPLMRADIIASSQTPSAGIIAKGPNDVDAFYIATSWGETASGSFTLPSIATRTLRNTGNAFEFEANRGKESSLKFKDKKYRADYIYGFASDSFIYFLAVQETYKSYKNTDINALKQYETKISQFCQKDQSYATYTEIPLKCTSRNGTDFNIATSAFVAKPGANLAKTLNISTDADVLFVTFSSSKPGFKTPQHGSGLCYYSVAEIKASIKKNIKKCYEGSIPRGMPWANGNGNSKCTRETYRVACPQNEPDNYPIEGSISLTKIAILEENNLVSLTAMPYEDNTAVFMGDTNGNLIKASLGDGNSQVKPYYKKTIAAGKSIKKLVISRDQQSVYVATSRKVMKLPIDDCSSHSTCQSCTGHGDPFCGWCSLYTNCKRRAMCSNHVVHPLRFTTDVSKCIQVVSAQPQKVPYGSVIDLEATFQSLPPRNGGETYKCYFDKQESPTVVYDYNNTVRCTTPASGLPPITSDSGDIQVKLSLFSTETRRYFVSTKIPFYDCTKMKSCVACADHSYDCDWCTYKGKCFADGSSQCPGEIVLSKKKRPANAIGCPYLTGNQSIFIPNGISSPIVFKATNLPALKYNYGFKCILLVGKAQTPFHVEATRDSDTQLTCNPKLYKYSADTQYSSAEVQVLWRGEDQIAKHKSVTVSLYKCSVGRGDCSTCLVADKKLKCGWCKAETDSCQVEQACSLVWKQRSQRCDTVPQIRSFWPVTGPTQGGTIVEIEGVDFGKEFSDIKNTVFISNYSCIPDPKRYHISKKIVCNTTSSGRDLKGPVRVIVNNFEGISKTLFSYQTPKVLDFHPKKGPMSGGSFVNITGTKLNTGRTIKAWLGDIPCLVDRDKVTDTSIPCVSQPSPSSRSRRAASNETLPSSSGDVIVSFDGFKPPSPPVQFEFTADPVFDEIFPDKTFPSGGLLMTVTGKHFDSVQVPKMFYTKASDDSMVSQTEICTVTSSTTMTCPSPNVTYFGLVPGSVNDSQVIVGFIMDSVQGLGNVTSLSIVKDPSFTLFEDVKEINTENLLVLEGNNLELLTKDQVTVTIEGVHCNVTAVADTNVVCKIPSKSTVVDNLPEGVKRDEFALMVKAAFLTFVLGKVKYMLIKPVKKTSMLYVYIGVAVGGFVLLVVIVCLICAYRKKRRQQYQSNERYEMKIANMESKVAKECRKAFAELQTDMTDWTNDLSEARMPFWDFRTYALHVLFPGVVDHPVLNMKSNLTPNWEKGLRKFAQLIHNKDFLLTFVRTLEQQNNFNMKDRCNLASLIMVALQAKMEYATDILRQLLCELVRKSVAQSHPKLLLRRTESVAEKLLTNWLAFCMYNHLKDESGKPLFMLFMAIKYNIEKGPLDALTGDARYSLSENKLLRHTIEFEVLRVSVSQDDEAPIQVNLLDTDTITQAKNKILDTLHKHEPYSSRPKHGTFQLSWLSSEGIEKVLVDDDTSSVVEGQWRRLNTLGHYKVPNDAFLKLSTHHTHFYGSTGSDLQVHSVPRTTFKPFSYAPLSRGSREDLIEEGGKVWHLLKQVDYTLLQEDTKMMPEIYLTRLLATKGILQQFVDDLFDAIFTGKGNSPPPLPIKFMFDLLDEQARELNLSDPEVIHTWKNNSLPLRFWINIVKNPNFIFDLYKGGTADSCLSVIAQLFMDACSTSDDRLSEDSPSNKLLYAKDISNYKKRVERYYTDIRSLPKSSDDELSDFFADLSMQYGKMFNSDVALKELFRYVLKYQDQLQDRLEETGFSKLASNLEHLAAEIADD